MFSAHEIKEKFTKLLSTIQFEPPNEHVTISRSYAYTHIILLHTGGRNELLFSSIHFVMLSGSPS